MNVDFADQNVALSVDLASLAEKYRAVRADSVRLAAAFSHDDWMLQSMEDASPIKWNIAHTSWFFETFALRPYKDEYDQFDERFAFLFNSYYNAVGERLARRERGLISRPSAGEILDYRDYVDAAMARLLAAPPAGLEARLASLVTIGCAHEEQHQELMLTDVKHALSRLPESPAIFPCEADDGRGEIQSTALSWISVEPGVVDIGKESTPGEFAFDNEGPVHKVFLKPCRLASRLVTNADYLEFINDGGYRDPAVWLSDGWDLATHEGWRAPLYWREADGEWREHTLFGARAIDPAAPVAHVSYYEAAAFAEWSGYRLPTEFEWERAVAGCAVDGNFLDARRPSPPMPAAGDGLRQCFGDLWEWTSSAYAAYPGYRTPPGAIGEYNGKFMSGQMVLRGGSCATPRGHVRSSYRNFFPPSARWQFSGFRLARDD